MNAELADDYWVRGVAHTFSAKALTEIARMEAAQADVDDLEKAVFNGTYSASIHLLAGFALELFLKSACYLHGGTTRRLKEPALRHDLAALLAEAERLGFVSNVSELKWVAENLTGPHRNHQFRYGGAAMVMMPPLETTLETLDKLAEELRSPVETAIDQCAASASD